jgi:hypothetical protein
MMVFSLITQVTEKEECEALTIRDSLKSLLPSCNRMVAMGTLIASAMVITEVDWQRVEWDIGERRPKTLESWVKRNDQMGAGLG